MKTTTKTLFLFAFVLFMSKAFAQTPCNYAFTYTVNGTTVTFNNTPNVNLAGVIPNTIAWTWDTLNFANTNDPIFTGATPGYHIVCMVVFDLSCIANPTTLSCDTVFIAGGAIGISENELAKSIQVFPNPSNGKMKLISSLVNVKTIAVYNTLGAIVFEEKEPQLQNELDLTTLPNGIYIVRANTEAGIVTKKITIHK